jgi:hypothetical protein
MFQVLLRWSKSARSEPGFVAIGTGYSWRSKDICHAFYNFLKLL